MLLRPFRKSTLPWLPWIAGVAVVVVAAGLPPAHAGRQAARSTRKRVKSAATGQEIFRQRCAACHGAHGEGTPAYSRSLAGNQSAGQLAQFISLQMPPGPVKCTGPDATKVASYIYDAFYSPIAQERNRPARVALSRLTVRQYRNSVSDLISSFRGQAPLSDAHGLRAEYFKARNFSDNERVLQRTDPDIQFNFGQDGPVPDKFDPHQFSIRWSGSLIAPDTGVYDIDVHTEHAIRLWINDNNTPLIDAWVRSGNDTDHRASIYLVGGRVYSLRLEFSKSTQGVDDTEKNKGKPAAKASIALLWTRPKQTEEPIPSRCLLSTWAPDTFVVDAPFPPDDRSTGYERANSISREWDDATEAAALETADYVVQHRQELAGTTDDVTQLKAFSRKFVERAIRRPLDPDTAKRYIDRQFDTAPDPVTAMKRVVLLTLMSPRFLYREIGATAGDPYATASRLSFALWDSLPDDTLLQAAASGQLVTREQVARQAERMAADPRAWYKQREFFLQWLKIDQYPDLIKDPKRFPDFTPAVATDLRTSFDLTLENVVRSDRSDFRDLMQTDTYYLNGRLAPLYGVALPPDAPFQPVALDPNIRSGVLTHPYILATFAYFATSSPIHRGVLLARNIMGRTLHPPPAAFAPTPASLHPDLTTRQRVSLQTRPAMCTTCHGIINPLGFTLERFDAIGRLRDSENGHPIDTTGSYVSQTGAVEKFADARDLTRFVADSDETHSAFVERLFQYMIKQPIRAYGPGELPSLEKRFQNDNYSIRELVVNIATESALPGTGKG